MTKKIVSLIQVVLQVIALFLLYIPGVYSQENFRIVGTGRGVSSSFPKTFFFASRFADSTITATLTVIAMIVAIAYFVLCSTIQFSWIKKKIMIIIPCLQIIPLTINAILVLQWKYISDTYQRYDYDHFAISILFYVICAIIFFILVLELFKHFSKIPEKREKSTKTSDDFHSRELTELYTLLNNGIITQEEFDAKKKQLLGL